MLGFDDYLKAWQEHLTPSVANPEPQAVTHKMYWVDIDNEPAPDKIAVDNSIEVVRRG